MNRQERRRQAREGQRRPAWDLIITAGVGVAILAIFAAVYFFPNLNLTSYESATPRVLRMIVNRGIGWLEEDWQGVKQFAYGYYAKKDEWPSYTVNKGADKWTFTSIDDKKVTEYASDELPEFYHDLPQMISALKAGLDNKEFKLAFQPNSSGYNDVSLIRVVDSEKGTGEQFVMSFNAAHKLDRVIYYDSSKETPVGYSFVDLYKAPEAAGVNP